MHKVFLCFFSSMNTPDINSFPARNIVYTPTWAWVCGATWSPTRSHPRLRGPLCSPQVSNDRQVLFPLPPTKGLGYTALQQHSPSACRNNFKTLLIMLRTQEVRIVPKSWNVTNQFRPCTTVQFWEPVRLYKTHNSLNISNVKKLWSNTINPN